MALRAPARKILNPGITLLCMRLFNQDIATLVKLSPATTASLSSRSNTVGIPKGIGVTSLPRHCRLVVDKPGNNNTNSNNHQLLVLHPHHHHRYLWDTLNSYSISAPVSISDHNKLVNNRARQKTWLLLRPWCGSVSLLTATASARDSEQYSPLPNMTREYIDLTSDDDEVPDSRALSPPSHSRIGRSSVLPKTRPKDVRAREQQGNIPSQSPLPHYQS